MLCSRNCAIWVARREIVKVVVGYTPPSIPFQILYAAYARKGQPNAYQFATVSLNEHSRVANTWRSCAHGSRVVAAQNSRKKALRRSSGEERTNGSTESFAWSGREPGRVRKKRPPLQRIEYQRVEGLLALFCRVHICGDALQTLTYHNHETWLRTLTETHNEGEICDTPRFWVSGAHNANGVRLSRRCYATLIESQHAWEALQRMMCSIRGPIESPNSGHNPYK